MVMQFFNPTGRPSRVQVETQQDSNARAAVRSGGPVPFQPPPLSVGDPTARFTAGEQDVLAQIARRMSRRRGFRLPRRRGGLGSGIEAILGFVAAGLLLNYVIDLHVYFGVPFTVPLAALQVYLPILGSSLLFARLFQRSRQSNVDFGMNILGALFGGILEYSSLVVGIRSIYLLALGIFLGFAMLHRRARA